jgi:hypothetical protein
MDTAAGVMKVYSGTAWDQMSNKFSASGGTITTYGNYKVHTFTSSGTFTVDSAGAVDILIVAAGGGTGNDVGGGGGAGGLCYASNYTLSPAAYPITVGSGGASAQSSGGRGSNGNNSTGFSVVTNGGGGGGGYPNNGTGLAGGSGGGGGDKGASGGSSNQPNSYSGFTCFGNSGGASNSSTWSTGGGGGAGGPGGDAPTATTYGVYGPGKLYDISGTNIEYSRGGRGSNDGTAYGGVSNPGWGHNGLGAPNQSPYNGGDGIVIIRYAV